jgi:hypothetical protein
MGCNHNKMSQWWQRTQPQMGLFMANVLTFCIKRIFWRIFFATCSLRYYNSPKNYMICVNSFLINMNCLKVYKFCQILCFILKNDHNFKSCLNMLTILSFSFLSHKPQLCSYVIHIMTHLHLKNDSWIWTI